MKENSTKLKITFENEDRKLTWESPYIDSSMEEILDAVYGMCITMTWHPYTVLKSMHEFSKERLESMASIASCIDMTDEEMNLC